jgi:phage terminase small subunit
MRNKLTPKQEKFAQEYLVDLNATAAAARAGYKDPNKGRQLVAKSNVSESIQQLIKKRADSVQITARQIIEDIIRRGKLAEEAGQFGPSLKASELLAKHAGLFIERTESSGIMKIIVERHD